MKKYFVNFALSALHLYEMVDWDHLPPYGEKIIYRAGNLLDSASYLDSIFMGSAPTGSLSVKLVPSGVNHILPVGGFMYDRGIVEESKFYSGQQLTEEEYQAIMNPYPKEVLDIVDILKNFGEFWKDDCGEIHLDDVQMYPSAAAILNYFKPKEDVKEVTKETKPESKVVNETTESFEQIVKKRKEKNEFSFDEIRPKFVRRTYSPIR